MKRNLHTSQITKYLKSDDINEIKNLADALGNVQRLKIIQSIIDGPKSITELSNELNIPTSNIMFHVRILEDVKLVKFTITNRTTFISMLTNNVVFKLNDLFELTETPKTTEYNYEILLGNYLDIISNGTKFIIAMSENEKLNINFQNRFSSDRFKIQLLTVTHSILVYPLQPIKQDENLKQIHISLEMCSEAPFYRNDFASDVEFYIDDICICSHRLEGDFGGRKGILNPSWYPISNTQYGELIYIVISELGVTINGKLVNTKININNIDLNEDKIHTFKFGNSDKKGIKGGMNIFGKAFGDHPQNIKIKYIINKE